MPEFEARVSFYGMEESAVDASVSVDDEHLTIEVSGRHVGRWPIGELSPEASGDSVVVSAEGERIVIDVTDPDQLRISLRVPGRTTAPSDLGHVRPLELRTATNERSAGTDRAVDPVGDHRPIAQHESVPSTTATDTPRRESQNLQASLAAAQTQLRWVQDLVPRRLPILTRADEAGLGVVQGVSLKERRPLPGSDGLQPWVVVDSGNVYVTDRRFVFSGAQDVEFEFGEIVKKGASPTGLLLGVSSRIQTHILAGPGERLAVVLTAAEKIASGVDPTVPFRDAIARLTAEIDQAQLRVEELTEADLAALDPSVDLV